jgi:predicted Zn-dependent protease
MLWITAFVLLQGAVADDRVVNAYVEKVCAKLAGHVAITVSADPGARAGVVPDGPISITNGMIAGAQNEAELAGILAHEIAHWRAHGVCYRFVKGEDRERGDALAMEHAADQAAIAILVKAGYDPASMLRYFSRIRHAEPDLPIAFSAEDILLERLQLEATDHPMKDPVVDTAEFQAVRARFNK